MRGNPFNAGWLKRRGLVARPYSVNPWTRALPVLCFSVCGYLLLVAYLKWRSRCSNISFAETGNAIT